MPKFLLDENLSPRLAAWLRRLGYEAQAVREAGLKGKGDEEIIPWLQKNEYVLITSDLDFGEFFYWKEHGRFGTIVFRAKSQSIRVHQRILALLRRDRVLNDENLTTSLIVATESGWRKRKFE